MSYRPIGAGHAAQEAPRSVEQDDMSYYLMLANDYANNIFTLDTTLALLEDVRLSVHAAGLLAIDPRFNRNKNSWAAGTLISAIWKVRCTEHIIIYPHDTAYCHNIGEELPANKLLIVQGNAGDYVGFKAKGPIIIQGMAGACAGEHSTGPIIIQGITAFGAGNHAKGLLIEVTPTKISQSFRGTHITSKQYEKNKPLKAYVDRLLELAQNDPAAIEERFGDGTAITQRLETLVRSHCGLFRRRV